jgi:hypothetical protein
MRIPTRNQRVVPSRRLRRSSDREVNRPYRGGALHQCDDQGNEKPVAYMSQILSDDEFKYFFIEKHVFALVKVVENFRHFILGKHTLVKVSLPAIKFLLSQTYLSGKLAHWLAKI